MDAERQRKMAQAEVMIMQLPPHLTSPVNIKQARNDPAKFWSNVLWNTRNDLRHLDDMIIKLEKMMRDHGITNEE